MLAEFAGVVGSLANGLLNPRSGEGFYEQGIAFRR